MKSASTMRYVPLFLPLPSRRARSAPDLIAFLIVFSDTRRKLAASETVRTVRGLVSSVGVEFSIRRPRRRQFEEQIGFMSSSHVGALRLGGGSRLAADVLAVQDAVRALAAGIRVAADDAAKAEVRVVTGRNLQLLLKNVATVPIPSWIDFDLQELPVA